MTRSLLRRCIACFLIALLPLQAAAVGRLALCAELAQASTSQQMSHCEQMAESALLPADSAPHSHEMTGCWLGSVCQVSAISFALPVKPLPATTTTGAAPQPATTALYLSIILDSPQRPPATL